MAGVRRFGDEKGFQDWILAASLPTLVAFTAEWCPPCAWLYPYLDTFAREGAGLLRVAAIDFDRVPALAERYRITSLPTVLLLEGGLERDRSLGVEPERLRGMVARAIARKGVPPHQRRSEE